MTEPITKDRDINNYFPFLNSTATLPTLIDYDTARKSFKVNMSTYLQGTDFENNLPRFDSLSQDFEFNAGLFDAVKDENFDLFNLFEARAAAIAKLTANQKLTAVTIDVIEKVVVIEYTDLKEISTVKKIFSDSNGLKFTEIVNDPANAQVLQGFYFLGLKLGAINPSYPDKQKFFMLLMDNAISAAQAKA